MRFCWILFDSIPLYPSEAQRNDFDSIPFYSFLFYFNYSIRTKRREYLWAYMGLPRFQPILFYSSRFDSIRFYLRAKRGENFEPIRFYSILIASILFDSILIDYILVYSTLFYSIRFYSIPGSTSSGTTSSGTTSSQTTSSGTTGPRDHEPKKWTPLQRFGRKRKTSNGIITFEKKVWYIRPVHEPAPSAEAGVPKPLSKTI